jgi:hypothetical protein
MEAATTTFTSVSHAKSTTMRQVSKQRGDLIRESKLTPITSGQRLQASADDLPFNLALTVLAESRGTGHKDTVLYLGYGSNLSAETFRGKRNIKPLSQINVVVPALSLAFNLPGIPYTEPCFANSRYRDAVPNEKPLQPDDYHKDHWHKGLVGVVYEVTRADFVHIIATEGGGSGYQDVVVDCYALSSNPRDKVPSTAAGQPFKAHTLFAPAMDGRPDQSYAQPSARYLKLITDGAAEHSLPYEYQDFLHQIRTYQLSSIRQRLGQFVFMMLWAPIFLLIFGGAAAIFLRPDGTYPAWFAAFTRATFTACWASYDRFFKQLFGDGERTIGDLRDEEHSASSEKAPLIQETIAKYGINGRLETIV